MKKATPSEKAIHITQQSDTTKTVVNFAKKYDYEPRQSPTDFRSVIELAKYRQVREVWLNKTALVISLLDLQGNIQSFQFIYPDGRKRFLKNSAVKSHFPQLLTRQNDDDPIVICEGFATGCWYG